MKNIITEDDKINLLNLQHMRKLFSDNVELNLENDKGFDQLRDNLDEAIDILEKENDEAIDDMDLTIHKNTSFIQNLIQSLSYKKSSTNGLKYRFQKMAGIKSVDTTSISKLTIDDKTIGFDYIPKWYNIIRYKVCGFKFEILRKD